MLALTATVPKTMRTASTEMVAATLLGVTMMMMMAPERMR
jgi:hypothetical protein